MSCTLCWLIMVLHCQFKSIWRQEVGLHWVIRKAVAEDSTLAEVLGTPTVKHSSMLDVLCIVSFQSELYLNPLWNYKVLKENKNKYDS